MGTAGTLGDNEFPFEIGPAGRQCLYGIEYSYDISVAQAGLCVTAKLIEIPQYPYNPFDLVGNDNRFLPGYQSQVVWQMRMVQELICYYRNKN